MSRHGLTTVWCTVFVFVTAASIHAQRSTGEIIGKVTDESGAVLPGVTVTLRGAGVAGAPTVVTSEAGVYRFPLLPPGTYQLEYVLAGFTPLKRADIPVAVGATVQLDAILKLGTVQETVTVSGEAPVVNTASVQTSTTYNREYTRNLPIARLSYWDVPLSAPGIVRVREGSAGATSLGSSTNENAIYIDGTEMSGIPWPNADVSEEAEVLQLGASAEFGNVQGAVLNVITRQGSNQLHGDVNYYYQNDALTGRNTKPSFDKGWPYHRERFQNATFQATGPFVRDKLWFFFSFEYQDNFDSQPGSDPAHPFKDIEKRLFWKLNYQINNNHRLMNGWHDDIYTGPDVTSAFLAPSTLSKWHGHNPTPNVVYNGIIGGKTLVEARVTESPVAGSIDPVEPTEPRIKTRFEDLDSGFVTGGTSQWLEARWNKPGFQGKVKQYIERFLGGSHDLGMGVQGSVASVVNLIGPNDTISILGGRPLFGTTQRPYYTGTYQQQLGAFIDDTYRLGPRVTLNLGMRLDHSKGYYPSFPFLDPQGNPAGERSAANDDVFHWNVVSPRLGINYRIASGTVIKGHYGRYYNGLGISGDFGDVVPSVTPLFTFDIDAAGNRTNFTSQRPANTRIDHNRKAPYADQYIVQIEHELMRNLGLQVNYVHKRGGDYPGWQDTAGRYVQVPYVDNVGVDATGQTVSVWRLTTPPDDRVFLLTTLPDLFTRFHGVTFVATKRMSNRWQGVFSLVLSRAEGRISSSAGTSITQSSAAGSFGRANGPNDYVNTEGRLKNDRPVVAKAQVVYSFPWQVLASVNTEYLSGRMWSRQMRVPGLGFPSPPAINMESNTGKRRMSPVGLVDVRVQKSLTLPSSPVRLALFVDVFNLMNSDADENVGSRLGTSSAFGVPSLFLLPRRAQLGAKIVW
jgi:Carboxypeptidase regulatory-like domain/TonB dependent receptor